MNMNCYDININFTKIFCEQRFLFPSMLDVLSNCYLVRQAQYLIIEFASLLIFFASL